MLNRLLFKKSWILFLLFLSFTIIIYTRQVYAQTPCVISSASWGVSQSVVEGTSVTLSVVGSGNCDGKILTYQIYEDDFSLGEIGDDLITTLTSTFNQLNASTTWTTIWQDDVPPFGGNPEYYFKASIDNNSRNSTNITVTKASGITLSPIPAGDWPFLGYDVRHTGSSPDQPNPPYSLKWYRDFFDKTANPEPEVIFDGIQPVISSGKIYFGTSLGNVYALDNINGSTVWKTKLPSKVMTSGAVDGDNLYIGSGRSLYALNKNTGAILWHFDTEKTTLLSSPIVVSNQIYFGSPDGYFYAINSDGSLAWRYQVGYPILQPAAFANDKIYFAAQDLKIYALDATNGQAAWISNKLPGSVFSEHFPVISNGILIIRSKPADITEGTIYKNGLLAREELLIASWATGMTTDAYRTCATNWGAGGRTSCITGDETGTAQQLTSEQNSIVNYLTQNPQNQTFFAFDLETGQFRYNQPIPVLYCNANGTLPPPPVVYKKTDGSEDIYTPYRSFYSNLDFVGTWSIFAGLGKFNPIDGSVNQLNSTTGPRGSLMMICDEYTGFSMGGSRLFSKHWYSMGSMDVNNPVIEDVVSTEGEQNLLSHLGITNRDLPFGMRASGTGGGAFGAGGHFSTGPVISEKTIYAHFHSTIFAIGGQ